MKIRDAVDEYRRWLSRYRDAVRDARFKKIETAVTSVLALGAGAVAVVTGAAPILAAVAAAPGLAQSIISVKALTAPIWKEVADKEFAPAGVVYEAQQLFG